MKTALITYMVTALLNELRLRYGKTLLPAAAASYGETGVLQEIEDHLRPYHPDRGRWGQHNQPANMHLWWETITDEAKLQIVSEVLERLQQAISAQTALVDDSIYVVEEWIDHNMMRLHFNRSGETAHAVVSTHLYSILEYARSSSFKQTLRVRQAGTNGYWDIYQGEFVKITHWMKLPADWDRIPTRSGCVIERIVNPFS